MKKLTTYVGRENMRMINESLVYSIPLLLTSVPIYRKPECTKNILSPEQYASHK